MTSNSRTVVVVTRVTMIKLERREDVFAARFKSLGLTAYGHTTSEAMRNLKKMFNRFIHLHRNAGTLEARLEQAGVEWSWADEYMGNYEDTNQNELTNSEQLSLYSPTLLATAA